MQNGLNKTRLSTGDLLALPTGGSFTVFLLSEKRLLSRPPFWHSGGGGSGVRPASRSLRRRSPPGDCFIQTSRSLQVPVSAERQVASEARGWRVVTETAGGRPRALAERNQARVPEPAWRAPSGRCRHPEYPRVAKPAPSKQQRRCAGAAAATTGRTQGPKLPPRSEQTGGAKDRGLKGHPSVPCKCSRKG